MAAAAAVLVNQAELDSKDDIDGDIESSSQSQSQINMTPRFDYSKVTSPRYKAANRRTKSYHKTTDEENNKILSVINIALLEIDPKTGKEFENPENKWSFHNTHDNNISVVYRKFNDGDSMITMRACMDLEIDNINEVYEFFDCRYNDDLKIALKNDKFMKSFDIPKVYSNDRCLVYAAFGTNLPAKIVKPRDFCYIKTRFGYDNFNSSDLHVRGLLTYSVDSTHSDFVKRAHKHIRGWIHYSGVIILQKTNKLCTLCYVANVDLCGKVPKKIVNVATPQQGMNIKKFAAQMDEAKEILAQRQLSQLNLNADSNDNNSNNNNNNNNNNKSDSNLKK